MWKEMVLVQLEVLGVLRKTTNSLTWDTQCPVEIKTDHLPNTSQTSYGLSLLSLWVAY
jgi:hypothetical protein